MAVKKLLQHIEEIEKETFTDAWSYDALCDTMRYEYNYIFYMTENIKKTESPYDIYVAKGGADFDEKHIDNMLGYIIANNVCCETELLRIAIYSERRQEGFGEKLLDYYIDYMKNDSDRYLLEVRESNEAARGLYQKKGYKPLTIRKNYYADPIENGVIYEKTSNI